MLEQLKARYPWPGQRPENEPDLGPAWFLDDDTVGHSAVLKRLLHPGMRVVLELGSFCGRSTRCFLRLCPNAHVIAVDTWKGSPDMQVNPEFKSLLPGLYETFLVNLWDHRDRLIPLRATTIRGMEEVHALGIPVDAIYVDADHSTPAVIEDVTCALRLFPDAQIIGDDWFWPSVRAAVTSVARQWGERICVEGTVWWFPRPATPRRGRPAPRVDRSAIGKAIAIMLYRRPEYLSQVLQGLARCEGIDDYQVVMHVEPGCPEVLRLARDIPLRRKTIVENTSILGATANACSAIEHAFRFSDYAIVLDDDIVPAPDCLRFFQWAGETYRFDREVFTVSAYSRETPPPARYHAARRVRWFTPWGWATWRDRWEEMRAHWGFGEPFSWDVIVNRTRGERFEIQPFLSRVQNIGAEGGVHVPDAQWHREHQFNEFGAWSVSLSPSDRFTEEPVDSGADGAPDAAARRLVKAEQPD